MSRKDYDHWNEDADYMWYMEEGRHQEEPPEYDDYEMSAAEARAEQDYDDEYNRAYEVAFEDHEIHDTPQLRGGESDAFTNGYRDGWATAEANEKEEA